ncbi:hypothetical protein SAMN02910409_2229 [Prevotellaceae bacterium HUN156]|nr:hypothetical protein SAMN02910409_2229 [Prevotellaceae bacterium HUN156]
MKTDGVYIYNIIADDKDPIRSNSSYDLLFSCKDDKFEWLCLPDGVRFCIPIKKENGEPFDNIEDFLSNIPKGLDLKLDFDYKIIEHKSNHNIGEYYKNIYRPVVSYKLQSFHLAKQGNPYSDSYDDISIWNYRKEYLSHLRQLDLILEELKIVFRVLEPTIDNKEAYGNSLRNIILLSCTEIDSMMSKILKSNGVLVKDDRYSTNDYVKLKAAMRLNEYSLEFYEYEEMGVFSPYSLWNNQQPTQSLPWYDVYNKIKHDRETYLKLATLDNALASIAAYAIIIIAQYGKDNSIWKEHMKMFFNITNSPKWYLEDFYIPHIHNLIPINYPF